MDRHDKDVWMKTIDAVVFLASVGENNSREYTGKMYKLPSGNVVLDYVAAVRIRHVEVLMPEDPNRYTPWHGTATVLFSAQRSLSEPKFSFDPPKDRWRVGHVEDRPLERQRYGGQWYDELLQYSEAEARRVAQITPQP